MRVKDLKQLVQNFLHTSKEDRFSKEELLTLFPTLVKASREANKKPLHLYRILKIVSGEKENAFSLDCTTKSLATCFDIADDMPTVVWSKDKNVELITNVFSFIVPSENIYLDINVILPIIKEKLSKVLNHKVYDKYGDAITIARAIELYEDSDEKEVIADLTNLEYKKVTLPIPFRSYSASIIFKAFEENKKSCLYEEDIASYYTKCKPIMSDEYKEKMREWSIKIKFNIKN